MYDEVRMNRMIDLRWEEEVMVIMIEKYKSPTDNINNSDE